MADQAIQLVVRKGPRPGQVFPLTQEAMSIGRDPLSDIVLDDPEVSRQHARLTRVGEGYHLQDVGSTNGTFVDGQRLTGESVPLKPGQVIMMGSNVTLIAQATSESDPLATMIAPSIEAPEAVPEPAAAELPDEPEPEFEAPAFEMPPPVEEMDEAAEEAVSEVPDMATMLEESPVAGAELEPESDALPAYEEPPPFPAAPESELEKATPFPPELEPEPEDATELLPYFEEPAAAELPDEFPAEPEPLPSFEEAPPPPIFEEPEPMPSFEEPAPKFPEPEPSLEEPPKFDSGEPMGTFEPEPPTAPPPASPPPDAGDVKEPNPNRNRNIIIAVVVILLLCCCCVLIAAVVAVANTPGGFDLGSFSALLPAGGSAHIV